MDKKVIEIDLDFNETAVSLNGKQQTGKMFWTTDKKSAVLKFFSKDFYYGCTASLVLNNITDGSIVQKRIEVAETPFDYMLSDEEITRAGTWYGQVVVEKEGISLTNRMFSFVIQGSLLDMKEGALIDVYDYKLLHNQLKVLRTNLESYLTNANASELARESNYLAKVDAAIVSADIESKVSAKVTELTPTVNKVVTDLADFEKETTAQFQHTVLDVNFSKNYTQFGAHRGAESVSPENTMKSFENAVKMGFDFLEMDTICSVDGQWFVFHDDSLPRMTNGLGLAKDKTIAEIKNLTITGGNFINWSKNTKIPMLEDVLIYAKKENKPIYLEIKSYHTQQNIIDLDNMITQLGLHGLVYICGSHTLVEVLKNVSSKLNLMIFYVDSLEFKQSLLSSKVAGVTFQYTEMTKELVNDMHSKGKLVNVWTVTDLNLSKRMVDMGVDSITGSVLS